MSKLCVGEVHGEWDKMFLFSAQLPFFYQQGYRVLFMEMIPETGNIETYVTRNFNWGYPRLRGKHPYIQLYDRAIQIGFRVIGLGQETRKMGWDYLFERMTTTNKEWALRCERHFHSRSSKHTAYIIFCGKLHCSILKKYIIDLDLKTY